MINKYTVFFSGREDNAVPTPYIKIRATGSPTWNDFLFNFQALIEINPGDGREIFVASAYVMPTSIEATGKRLGTWIKEGNCPPPTVLPFGSRLAPDNDDYVHFLTLLNDPSAYEQLKRWAASQEEKYAILIALNDVVFLRNTGSEQRFVADYFARPNFKLGVLRSASAFRALRRGWSMLESQHIATIQDARSDFRFRSQLHGFGSSWHDLNIKFTSNGLFEDRIHTLIGINGSGKTRLLRELILELFNQHQENSDHSADAEKSEAVCENSYSGPAFNRIIAFSSDHGMRFPPSSNFESPVEYHHFSLVSKNECHFGEKRIPATEEYLPRTLSSIIVDLLRDDEIFESAVNGNYFTRFEILKRTIGRFVEMDALYLPLQQITDGNYSWVEYDEEGKAWVKANSFKRMNEQRKLELTSLVDDETELAFLTKTSDESAIRKMHLSSGQAMFFRFAVRFIDTIDKGTLVLIDEPETHLHPNLICEFMTLLYEVLGSVKSIALIATHSAYIVRETPTHCVHLFSLEDEVEKKIAIGRVRLKTLGASIDSISQAVFGDSTAQKYHEKIARDIAHSESSLETVLLKYEKIMSPELLIEIRALMASNQELPSA